jgi:hypothetical protein
MVQVALPHRRAYVISFWFVLTSLMAMGALAAGLAAGLSAAWVWALGVAFLFLLPGLFTARYFNLGISAWNRATSLTFRVLRKAAMRLCFYIIFPLLQHSGTSMGLELPGSAQGAAEKSNWHIHNEAARRAMKDAVRGEAWFSGLFRHGRTTGNWWLLSLVPLIFTLTLMGEEVQETAPPTSTYTLY